MKTRTNMHPADLLGSVNSQIADLKKIADQAKADLTAMGAGSHEGDLFRATVSIYDTKGPDEVLKAELDAVAEAAIEAHRATLSRQYLIAHTVTKSNTRVAAKAKTGVKLGEDVAA